ncbi:MAG: tetratricopeptide repeat protein [Neisseriaceae bacterium]|nr:MAG: tetratricopeptide repeat protein [Neisseriaceae bacterium]
MRMKLAVAISSALLLSACVTRTINSDGSVQSTVIDKNKLSDTYIDLAIEYQQHSAPQVALERANLAVSTKDDNPKAYMIRAMIYQQLGQYDKAEQDFKKALWLDSKYSEDNVNYAVFLCDQKRYSEAMYNFNQALDNPLYFTPEIGYYSRGNCYAKQDSFESANRDYLAALNYKSPPQDTYVALSRLQFNHQNYQLANYYLNRYNSSQTPETMWLHIQILQAMIDQGVSSAKYREYNSYRKTLGQLLIKNYGDTKEAQQYLLQYDASGAPLPSRKKALPEASSAVLPNNAAQSVTLFESPSEAVKTGSHKANTSANDTSAVIVVKSEPVVNQASVAAPNAVPATASNNTNAAVSAAGVSSLSNASGSSSGVSQSGSRRSIIVNSGDTLYSISRKYSVPVATLQKINNIGPRGILIGMKLYLDPQ